MWYLSQEPQNPLWIWPDKMYPLPPQRPSQDMSQHMGQIWQMKKPNQIKKKQTQNPQQQKKPKACFFILCISGGGTGMYCFLHRTQSKIQTIIISMIYYFARLLNEKLEAYSEGKSPDSCLCVHNKNRIFSLRKQWTENLLPTSTSVWGLWQVLYPANYQVRNHYGI